MKKDYDNILYFLSQIQTDAIKYRQTVLDLLDNVFGYNHMAFFLFDENSNIVDPIFKNLSNELTNNYLSFYFKKDIFVSATYQPEHPQKNVLSIQDIMPYREFEKTAYYNELISIDNLYYELAINLKNNNELLGGIGILKTKANEDFSKKDVMVLENISRHIAFNLKNHLETSKLQNEKLIYRDCIKQLPIGMILLDSSFSIIDHNETALNFCQILQTNKQNKEAISDTVQIILEKINKHSQLSSTSIHTTLEPFEVKITPFIVPNLWNTIDVYYVIYLTECSKTSLENFAAYYLLTDRERETVELIIQGLNNYEIAEKLYISPHTVKTHILNIFKKTDVSRRTTLLNKVNNFNKDY